MNDSHNGGGVRSGIGGIGGCKKSVRIAFDTNPAGRTLYGRGLAPAYDSLMREDFSYERYADYIEKIFNKYGTPPESLIADLGCGTGSLCVELAAKGYDVIGIDNSSYMLAEAREKAINAGFADILFLEQDICAFELYGTVGALVSTIDSINYITDKRRLHRLFKLAGNYLSSGGLFIFDLNTEYKLSKDIGNNIFYEISDDLCYLWQNCYNGVGKTSVFDLTLFSKEQDGRWRRFDEIHKQRAYAIKDIEYALRGTGLEIIGVYGFLSFSRPLKKAKKISYILKKINI